jgi:hypothetical protein
MGAAVRNHGVVELRHFLKPALRDAGKLDAGGRIKPFQIGARRRLLRFQRPLQMFQGLMRCHGLATDRLHGGGRAPATAGRTGVA